MGHPQGGFADIHESDGVIPILVTELKGPGPVVHREVAPLSNALQEGRFMVQRCGRCQTVRFPPAPACWRCLSDETELVELDGHGTVTTSVVVERITTGSIWSASVPYRCGLVELPHGLRVPGRILCDCGGAARPGAEVSMGRIEAEGDRYVFAFAHTCQAQL